MSRIARTVAACLAAFALSAEAQDRNDSFWSRVLSSINDTTPAGLKPRAERASGWAWFGDQWEAGKALAASGQINLFLPGYTHHPPAQFDNFERQNAYAFGAGIASYMVDDRDNERMVFALAFSDSHYNIQPMAGYAWVARWPVIGPVKGGLGYAAFITARNDSLWLPFPAVLPILSVGTDAAGLYAVYIPTQNVTFAFARLSGDAFGRGATPGAIDGRDARRNLLYAGYGHVKTDPSGIEGIGGTNGSGPAFGYRRFLGEHLAAELSFERSDHELSYGAPSPGSFRRTAYTLAAQYHFPIAQRVRLYGGIGIAYEHISQQQLVGASLESGSIGPVVQGGVSVDLSPLWTLTGGIRTGFPRNQLTLDGVPGGTVLLAPVTFSVALGARF